MRIVEKAEVFEKLTKVPLSYIDSTAHGDIINTVVTDIDIVSTGLLQGFTQIFSGIVTILGTLIFMFTINWYITLAVVVLTPLSFFVASFIAKHAHKNYVKQAKYRGEITGFAAEMIGSRYSNSIQRRRGRLPSFSRNKRKA